MAENQTDVAAQPEKIEEAAAREAEVHVGAARVQLTDDPAKAPPAQPESAQAPVTEHGMPKDAMHVPQPGAGELFDCTIIGGGPTGLAAAYYAYRLSFANRPAPTVAGLTGDQQFFLSYGQVWRSKTRDPALRQRLLTDGHAPGQYRALTVRNLDPWYAAFDVKSGEALYLAPQDRVRLW